MRSRLRFMSSASLGVCCGRGADVASTLVPGNVAAPCAAATTPAPPVAAPPDTILAITVIGSIPRSWHLFARSWSERMTCIDATVISSDPAEHSAGTGIDRLASAHACIWGDIGG